MRKQHTISRFLWTVCAALPLLTAVFLYGYAVRLPFFLDDGPLLWITESNAGIRQWDGTRAFAYYRPLPFSIWWGFRAVAGHYDPVALHLLNVWGFGLTGVLLGEVARRVVTHPLQRGVGVLAGLGYVLFPMSYQAVPFVGSLFHVWVTFSAALAVWAALRWLRTGRLFYVVLCWGMAFGGMFSHENGVLIAPGVWAVLWLRAGWPGVWRRRAVLAWGPVFGLAALYLVLWGMVYRSGMPGELQDFGGMLQSAGTLKQGLIYPFAALARSFVNGTASPWVMAALLAWVVLPLGVLILRRGGTLCRLAVVGVAWHGAGILPAVLMLDQHYVSGSPRILMFAAMGASLFWAAALAVLWERGKAGRLVGVAVVILAVMVSLRFLTTTRGYYDLQARYMWDLMTLVENQPETAENPAREGGIVLVNAPDYISPLEADRVFLRGSEGVAMMFSSIDYDTQIWANTGIRPPVVRTATYTQILRADGYSLYAHDPVLTLDALAALVRSGQYLYVTRFDGRDFWPVYVGTPGMTGPDTPLVTFGDGVVHLTQADAVYAPSKQAVVVRARWRVDVPVFAKPFTHVVCDGALVGQLDADPWGETYPFTHWTPGEVQTEFREVRLSQPFAPESCLIYMGLYETQTGVRLSATDAQTGESLLNDVFVVLFNQTNDAAFPYHRFD